ncbi:hypothetical protein AHAS_Ahas05G0155700 [Arachis hypogaea]
MPKDWMDLPRYSEEYINDVISFLEFAYFEGEPDGQQIQCPCKRCCNIEWYRRDVVFDHLVADGFVKGYRTWINHGEWTIPMVVDDDTDDEGARDDIEGLLNDAFGDHAEGVTVGPNKEAKKFYNLIDGASQELYPGCKKFSTLSFTICLYLLKCLHGWSNASFTSLLELLKEAMLEINIPPSFHNTKAMIRDLGLDYKKRDACPNDCLLYRKELKDETQCCVCGTSRYTENSSDNSENQPHKNGRPIPAKTLRYFPIIPRLQRLFMCSKTAASLRWHDEERVKDGTLKHPTDGLAWKNFDEMNEDFAKESRNIRLGLSSDGFNPFRSMNISWSTWPVMLMVYNLPPWMCMKPEYCMLSLLIPEPQSPGKDIDVYLQPLMEDLKLL